MRLNRMAWENPTRFNPGSLMRKLVRTGTYYCVGQVDRFYGTLRVRC
jgi:hypothetical protein